MNLINKNKGSLEAKKNLIYKKCTRKIEIIYKNKYAIINLLCNIILEIRTVAFVN